MIPRFEEATLYFLQAVQERIDIFEVQVPCPPKLSDPQPPEVRTKYTASFTDTFHSFASQAYTTDADNPKNRGLRSKRGIWCKCAQARATGDKVEEARLHKEVREQAKRDKTQWHKLKFRPGTCRQMGQACWQTRLLRSRVVCLFQCSDMICRHHGIKAWRCFHRSTTKLVGFYSCSSSQAMFSMIFYLSVIDAWAW